MNQLKSSYFKVIVKGKTVSDMLDFYNFLEKNPLFKQFKVDELLFAAYDCPIEQSPLDYWVGKNYFCYVIKGGAKWKTPSEEYVFKVGDAAFLKKGAHRVFKILTGEFCALLIFVPDEFISSVVKNDIGINRKPAEDYHTDSIIPMTLDQSLTDYFNTVLNYFSQPTAPSPSLLKVKFKEIIVNILTGFHNPTLATCLGLIGNNSKMALEPVMEENFVFNLKLEDFARLSGRSLATFNRDFVKTYHMSPGQWLKSKRLEYAKFLLETSDLSVNEITLEAGFENTSHFIKVFKAKHGNSPLKFRNSLVL